MQHKHLAFGRGFRVVLGDERSQAAQMPLAAGDPEGGPDNRHRGAGQWLFVAGGGRPNSDTGGEFYPLLTRPVATRRSGSSGSAPTPSPPTNH
jgi:hypothetical protein